MNLQRFPRHSLTFGPTPIQPMKRLSDHLGGKVELYAKREDCNSGLAFGGNKLRRAPLCGVGSFSDRTGGFCARKRAGRFGSRCVFRTDLGGRHGR